MSRTTTVLTCSSCGQETEHELIAVGRLLQSSRCTACGHVVRHDQHDLRLAYLGDLEHRLVTKPIRLARRAARDPLGFLTGLPRALIRQPFKLLDELRTVLRRD